MRCSSGIESSTASISFVFPAAVELWMMIANGSSSRRDVAARYATSLFVRSPTVASIVVGDDAVEKIRRAEKLHRIAHLFFGEAWRRLLRLQRLRDDLL